MIGKGDSFVKNRRDKKAIIFDINRYRIEDGPGIRTIVFFKGCPLRCLWCSNPFGLSPEPQLAYNQKKCVLCRACEQVCPQHAISFVENQLVTDWSKCTSCGTCTKVCLYEARQIIGKTYSPVEVVESIKKDFMFYRRDGGGVTLSGGEVMLQADVAKSVLELCCRELINTAIETAVYTSWDNLVEILPLCNLVFADIKHIDPDKHKQLTGVSNELILHNIRKLAEYVRSNNKPRLILRIPVIPGLNSDEPTMLRTAKFISSLPGRIEVNLLPYHRLGSDKYEMIGLTYKLHDLEMLKPKDDIMLKYRDVISSCAKNSYCTIGGGEIATNEIY